MAREWHSNGYTLIEMLFVMMILLIFSIPMSIMKPSLELFMKRLLFYSVSMQEKAFAEKREVDIEIDKEEATFDLFLFRYPNGITCTPISFHYNAKGNVSNAFHVTCSNAKDTKKLVVQLGSGRIRVE